MQVDQGRFRELAERAESGDAPTWRPLILAMIEVLERLPLPAVGDAALAVAAGQWCRSGVAPAALEPARVSVWQYLADKNGGSSAIADDEDRKLRAVLCVLNPPGSTEVACDYADFLRRCVAAGRVISGLAVSC